MRGLEQLKRIVRGLQPVLLTILDFLKRCWNTKKGFLTNAKNLCVSVCLSRFAVQNSVAATKTSVSPVTL